MAKTSLIMPTNTHFFTCIWFTELCEIFGQRGFIIFLITDADITVEESL